MKDFGLIVLILFVVAILWITAGGGSFKAPSGPQVGQSQESTTTVSESKKEEKPAVILSIGNA